MFVGRLETEFLQPVLPLVGSIVTVELGRAPLGAAVGQVEMSAMITELALATQVLQDLEWLC